MELHSQKIRVLAPENDPLKIGMGWTVEDLSKPQILVESTFGDSHPGSAHLDQFVEEGMRAIADNGGKGARNYVTDICDGIAQGHDGINYSLAHRDMMANMVEIHGNATGYDGHADGNRKIKGYERDCSNRRRYGSTYHSGEICGAGSLLRH